MSDVETYEELDAMLTGISIIIDTAKLQLVKYSNTSSTRNQVQVQELCIFTNQVLKYIKY